MQIVPTRRDQTHLFLGLFFQCSFSLCDSEGHFGRVISSWSALLSSLTRHNLSLFFFFLAFIIQTENGYGFSSMEKRVICFFSPFTRRLWNFSSTHIGVMWSFQPSEERVVMFGKPASSGWLPSPFMVRVVWPHIINNCSFFFLFFLGTVPAIFLKRKNSLKLLTKATWAYFVNLSLALISFYWCCKSRGYAWTWVLELKSKQACRRLLSLKKVCFLHKPFQKLIIQWMLIYTFWTQKNWYPTILQVRRHQTKILPPKMMHNVMLLCYQPLSNLKLFFKRQVVAFNMYL